MLGSRQGLQAEICKANYRPRYDNEISGPSTISKLPAWSWRIHTFATGIANPTTRVPGGRALEGGTLGRQLDRLRLANPAPAYRGNAVGGEQGKQFGGPGLQAGIGFGEIRDGGIGERDEGKAVVRRIAALAVAPVRRRTGWSGATP